MNVAMRMSVVCSLAAHLASACSPPPDSELYRIFRANPGNSAAVIERHIEDRFPVGSNDAPLVEYLKSQKLKVRDRNLGGYNEASVTWGPAVCSYVIGVIWRTDRSGTITELSANAGDTGCF